MSTFRSVLALLLTASLACLVTLRAEDPDKKAKSSEKSLTAVKEESAISQERLAKQFSDFEAALLNLAHRLERSSKPEDRERAVILKEAIKKAGEVDIPTKFQTLIGLLHDSKPISLSEAKEAMDQSKMLADDIRAILALLLNDNRDAQLKAEKERLKRILELVNTAIRETKVVRAQTESNQMEKKALASSQQRATKATENVTKAMGSKDSKNSNQDKGDGKSKGSQGQQGDKKQGDKKNDGQQSDKKDGDKQEGQETPGKKQAEDALRHQKNADEELKKDKPADASNQQDKAITKLEEAKKRLEEILRQLREEELERLLAALQARCERMLALQIEVYNGTRGVDRAIAQNPDKRASRAEEQRSLQLSDREQEIIAQANSAIQILENEGSGVAFPEVFTQVRDDMLNVARRLGKADVGKVTQTIEEDIIATLKEMIEALKKAQASRSSQGKPGEGQQGNQQLIDLIAELKVIRSLQIRVNSRTRTYAVQYTGEQAADPDIQRELGNLAQRQFKIFEVTNNLARGKNQ